MDFQQTQNRITEIKQELFNLKDTVRFIHSLENEVNSLMGKLQYICDHRKAYVLSANTDCYEGRFKSYDQIYCSDCGKLWEERPKNQI